jgi:signal transduction histidine kinase
MRQKLCTFQPLDMGGFMHGPADNRKVPGDEDGDWLILSATIFVLLALLVLAITPTLLLGRVSRTNREVTTVVLPVYEAVRNAGATMERRVSVARGALITGAPPPGAERLENRRAEAAALRVLRRHAPVLGERAVARVETLQRLALSRDSVEGLLQSHPRLDGTYPVALTRFDVLTDSMQAALDSLRGDLIRMAGSLFQAEMRWADTGRDLALALTVLAALAAAAVSWFGARDRRSKRMVQAALLEAEQRRAELERVTASRERLLRGFTHDVKNPLGAASGYLQMLDAGLLGALTPKQLRSVTRAERSIGDALAIVEDVLELARIESGILEIRPVPTDMRALVADVADEYRAHVEAAGLRFDVAVPDWVPQIETDRRRVAQVLGNLISNAVKYTREGNVTVRLEEPGADRLAVTIRDTGSGIAADQQRRVFDEFARVHPAAADGAGVGLAISQHIAKCLGGEITLLSQQGVGSTFTLYLPVRRREVHVPSVGAATRRGRRL